jgi:hypothetical protein
MAGGILEDDVSIFWKIETTVVGLDWLLNQEFSQCSVFNWNCEFSGLIE